MWVIQELLLAKKGGVVCGPRNAKLWALSDLARAIRIGRPWPTLWSPDEPEEAAKIQEAIATFVYIMDLRKHGPIVDGLPSSKFAELLNVARVRDVSLPVDRVWSLLGVAQPSLRKAALPLIDYSERGIQNHQLAYVNFVKVFLPTDTHLALFSFTTSIQRVRGFPSWCPDFNSRPPTVTSLLLINERNYHAGFENDRKPCGANINFPYSTTSLIIRGFCIDFVDQVIIAPDFIGAGGSINYHSLRECEDECLRLAQRVYEVPNGIPDAHWRTLVADHISTSHLDNPIHRCTSEVENCYHNFRRFFLQTRPGSAPQFNGLSDSERYNAMRYCDAALPNLRCYQYFSTRGGRVGMGPCDMQPGDGVCVSYGAKVPHIVRFAWIRRSFAGGLRRRTGNLVGDAYVHGLMYGEALSMGFKDERIILE
jgi:hypothetical protein